MATMDDDLRGKPAVLPPAPSHPDDGPGEALKVPRLEPPPPSLKPSAQAEAGLAGESRGFWLLLIALFVLGTAVTFYFQR
jgi:hypothetical protein